MAQHISKMPLWFWILLWGSVGILGISLGAVILVPEDSFERTVVGSLMLLTGVFLLVIAQIWLHFALAVEEPQLGVTDMILSVRLWFAAFRRLPQTGTPVCLGTCGLTAIVCALFIVGGLTYWLPDPESLRIAQTHKAGSGWKFSLPRFGSKGSTEVAEEPEPKKRAPKTKTNNEDTRPTLQCVVIGYVPGKNGAPSALVLAREDSGLLKYAGTVNRGLEPNEAEDMMARFSRLIQTKPAIAGIKVDAVWIKPVVICKVQQSGIAASGLVMDPRLSELLPPIEGKEAGAPTEAASKTTPTKR
jgi:hypothetical protein